MNVTKRIKLDFGRSTSPVVVWAKQGDYNSRKIEVEPMLNGMAYALPAGISAKFACKRPDGYKIVGSASGISNNVITVKLNSKILKIAGEIIATVILVDNSDESILSAQNFIIIAEENPFFDGEENPDDGDGDIETYTGEVEVV